MLLDYCAMFTRLFLKCNKENRTVFCVLSNKQHRLIKLSQDEKPPLS